MRSSKLVGKVVLGLTVSLFVGGQVMATEIDPVNIQATYGIAGGTDTANIYYNGTLNGITYSNANLGDAYVGAISFTASVVNSIGSPSYLVDNELPFNGTSGTNTFTTYCIDIAQDASNSLSPSFSNVTDDLVHTPVLSLGSGYTGMGTVAADMISDLYGFDYANSSTSRDASAAFQMAIWDIIFGNVNNFGSSTNYLALSSNNLYFGINSSIIGSAALLSNAETLINDANADYLAYINHGTALHNLGSPLLALTDSKDQDQLVVGNPSIVPNTTPTPAAAAGGLSLLAGLAFWKRARRAR